MNRTKSDFKFLVFLSFFTGESHADHERENKERRHLRNYEVIK